MNNLEMIPKTSQGLNSLPKIALKRQVKTPEDLRPILVTLSDQRDDKNEIIVTQPFKAPITLLGTLKRPWRRVKRD